jgi:hypothetical protein
MSLSALVELVLARVGHVEQKNVQGPVGLRHGEANKSRSVLPGHTRANAPPGSTGYDCEQNDFLL